MRIAVWGYWAPDTAHAFARGALGAAQKLTPSGVLLLDASELKPQGVEGQEALRLFLRGLAPLVFAKGVAVAINALTRMQLTRLIRECGVDARLEFNDSLPDSTGA